MEEILRRRIVGQDEAISAIARAIRRSRLGVTRGLRPIGSFLFLGPSGVGKTEVARQLASFLFQSGRALVRFDMSEYMEKHTVSRLVGSPPGYVGFEEGGQLTERVRRQPYSVILLDEIEKAHPDVANLLLQILEDGILTDAWGSRRLQERLIVRRRRTSAPRRGRRVLGGRLRRRPTAGSRDPTECSGTAPPLRPRP
jgi:ATP-dependent Clp protease ATP-binding subunit ClpC